MFLGNLFVECLMGCIDWIEEHKLSWGRKKGLRHYYQTEIFDRIIAEKINGNTLELGTGPGFFASYHPGMVNTDILKTSAKTIVEDVHHLSFDNNSFSNILGIDVFHHFSDPEVALLECHRVLKPGGKLVLVEPWTTPLGWLFYRFVHHEDCYSLPSPWQNVFGNDKDPMEGNATIPYTVFYKKKREFYKRFDKKFHIVKTVPFGSFSYLSTGGFGSLSLPTCITNAFSAIESALPLFVMRLIALRALIVVQKL